MLSNFPTVLAGTSQGEPFRDYPGKRAEALFLSNNEVRQKASAITLFLYYLSFSDDPGRDLYEERTKNPGSDRESSAPSKMWEFFHRDKLLNAIVKLRLIITDRVSLCRFELVEICDFVSSSLSVNFPLWGSDS